MKNKTVLLSIKPQYSDMILHGRKTVELRRMFNNELSTGTPIIIYSTSPVKEVVGIAYIKEVKKMKIQDLWAEHGCQTGVEHSLFKSYFQGLSEGYAVLLEKPSKLKMPISLQSLRNLFGLNPPQSYMYANDELWQSVCNDEKEPQAA